MVTVTQKELNKIIEVEWNYLVSKADKWSLLHGEQDMEILEHVLRCILHVGSTTEYANDFIECSKVQNSDGGWSKKSHEDKTSIWITTFVALKLCRGNLALQSSKVEESIQKALKYILASQKEDGNWSDVEWSHLDTTCSVTVFLTVYQVTHEEKNNEIINKARKRGFDFIINWQRESGLWKDDIFHPAGIETTAHLMQYTLIPAYFMDGIEYAQKICLEAANGMIKEQAENGSWDGENMDHTMDACRNLMLVADTFNQKEKYSPIIEKGVRWLMDGKNDQGWGDFKEELSNVERTADGLDTLLKYRRFCSGEPMSHFWAYSR
jgi:hypothetical protein